MYKVDKLVMSRVVKESFMKEVVFHLDVDRLTRQREKKTKPWEKEGSLDITSETHRGQELIGIPFIIGYKHTHASYSTQYL